MTTTTSYMTAQSDGQRNYSDNSVSSGFTAVIDATDDVTGEAVDCPAGTSASAVTATVDTAQAWAADVAQESTLANCTTIGLISGSRDATPRCVIDGYARLIADALSALRSRRRMLIVRLNGRSSSKTRRDDPHVESIPSVTASPLGPWSEVTICFGTGKQAKEKLEGLAYLLPNWKREFGFVMVDLGPISEVPSSLIGGHCDSCFVVLGPEFCGSHEWLLQQIAWHARSGSTICGTLVTELE